MTNRLVGRTALITGAGSGIGRQVATRFAAEGARVVLTDRDAAAATAAAKELDGTLAVEMDIADERSVEASFAAARAAGSCRTSWWPTPGCSCSARTRRSPTSTSPSGRRRSRSI